jgi:hypothetical protein
LKVFEIRSWVPAGTTAPFQRVSSTVSRERRGVVGHSRIASSTQASR